MSDHCKECDTCKHRDEETYNCFDCGKFRRWFHREWEEIKKAAEILREKRDFEKKEDEKK